LKSYRKIIEVVQDLDLENQVTKRLDCVVCGKRNTLTITRMEGKVLWNCYSASCDVGGVSDAQYSRQNITDIIQLENKKEKEEGFVIPEYFVKDVTRSHECLNYLNEFNCMDIFDNNPDRFCYDVKNDRLAFMTVHQGKVVGAVGRALKYGMKWYRYDNSHIPFIIGDNEDVAVVVEDCTSACVVSHEATGIALLGTNLLTEHISYIKPYKKVIVALDRDATDKAVDIQRKLAIHVDKCNVMILERDLKYENKDTIKDMFNETI